MVINYFSDFYSDFDKEKAIRHYRASYSLDPTYAPAIWNLERLGTGDVCKKCAYTEKDCK